MRALMSLKVRRCFLKIRGKACNRAGKAIGGCLWALTVAGWQELADRAKARGITPGERRTLLWDRFDAMAGSIRNRQSKNGGDPCSESRLSKARGRLAPLLAGFKSVQGPPPNA